MTLTYSVDPQRHPLPIKQIHSFWLPFERSGAAQSYQLNNHSRGDSYVWFSWHIVPLWPWMHERNAKAQPQGVSTASVWAERAAGIWKWTYPTLKIFEYKNVPWKCKSASYLAFFTREYAPECELWTLVQISRRFLRRLSAFDLPSTFTKWPMGQHASRCFGRQFLRYSMDFDG